MFALKMLDITHIIAVTAVGGITDKMSPMRWVIPDQLIDYTYSRMQTFNDGDEHEIKHIDFTEPFNADLRVMMDKACSDTGIHCVTEATYGVTQGPRLETAAEIRKLEKDGCDIVGMTAMPETALAKELEMDYATISLVVNRAAGKEEGIVSMDEIRQRIREGDGIISAVIENAAFLLYNDISSDSGS
jgi:purine nucleoside phosphorylase